ncbi:MAG: metallophosphatase domain-containing protein [Myxococcota bacterium]
MRVVAISDTHNQHRRVTVPDGDVLVHAGDITGRGSLDELERFCEWWHELPHGEKVIIAGNHDFCFERESESRVACDLLEGSHYLQDASVTLNGFTFYGSPWQPWFFDWAFNLRRGPALAEQWEKIPDETDVLVTHGPPYSILDETHSGECVGCEDLMRRVEVVGPRFHLFGHIHEAYGVAKRGPTVFANVSVCTLAYEPLNAPFVFDL